MGKKVLITGSEGFVGTHLWKELKYNGYKVYGTTLNQPENGLPKNVFQCDVTDKESFSKVINKIKPDYIFHLAAQASPGYSFKNSQLTFNVNITGTTNLLEVIKEKNNYSPRILLVGTSEEYGFVPEEDMPVKEDQRFNPANPYAVSKVSTYYISMVYHRAYKMDIVYAASFNHTGPGQSLGFLPPDVASQIIKIENGEQKNPLLTGNLKSKRDFSDVRDVVRAYRLLLEKGKAGERYNVCSGKSVSARKVVRLLINNSKVKINQRVDPERNRPSEMRVMYGTYKKLKKTTGWKPQVPLEQTLKDLLDWYRNRG